MCIDATFYKNLLLRKSVTYTWLQKITKIVPLTNLLKLLLAGRVVGGGSVLLGLY